MVSWQIQRYSEQAPPLTVKENISTFEEGITSLKNYIDNNPSFEYRLIKIETDFQRSIYEMDVAYNPKLLDWLKQFHVQISHGANNITINVPFSNATDYIYALKQLKDAITS